MSRKKLIVIFINNHRMTYAHRKELIAAFLSQGHRVVIVLPYGERIEDLKKMGCEFIDVPMFQRRKTNIIKDFQLFMEYMKILRRLKPDIVFGFTIKPNTYGAIAARFNHIPFVATINGLGTGLANGGLMQKLLVFLYRFSLKSPQKVFFQNEGNRDFMLAHNVVPKSFEVIPGSGVNLDENYLEPYPNETGELIFSVIGRVMKDKGTNEVIEAARIIKREFPRVKFRLIGLIEDNYEDKINSAVYEGIIEYIPEQYNVHPFIAQSHAIIQPSYHEGMSNILLEAASTGRPVLASKVHGCIETFDEGKSGLGFEAKNSQDLARVIRKFIMLPYSQKAEMGINGRKKNGT
ncbi:MAG: glycosyltransferase family 4 protein [Synergistaceae bacterium]|nr:glycosyltransferase family 4 protein [Synergistaceae bacterium]